MTKVYVAGPMTGIPAFNFPAFHAASAFLRSMGYDVVSPAEEDHKHGIGQAAEASKHGNPADVKETWGQVLARDVRMLADDGIDGIVFLDGWQASRGAKLEATVGLLCGLGFWEYNAGSPVQRDKEWVKHQLAVSL
jgi:hypothetical protein